jgi:hypothetical protein
MSRVEQACVHVATLPAQQRDRGILTGADDGDPRTSRPIGAQLHVLGMFDEASNPDPANLLADPEITLPDLQDLHEAVLGERVRTDTFRRRMEALLDEVIDPDDPKGKRNKTRPSGPSGGPPTRLWTKRSMPNDVPGQANRLLRLPRAVD